MNPQEIAQLQAQTEYPSVSILMPIYAASPDNRQQTPIRVKNLLRQAEERLRAEFSDRDIEALQTRLHNLAIQVDSEQAAHGLALFANPGFSRMYYLPFPVQERVSVNHGFATRDLVQAHVQSPRYLALSLSEKTTHLLEGVRDHLHEAEGCGFPVTLEVDGVRSELPGTYGIETTRLHDHEEREYFNRVQHALEAVLTRQNLPLALIGTTRTLAFFDEVTQHKGKPRFPTIARLVGNYEKLPRRDLEAKLWPLVEEGLHTELQKVKERYTNAVTEHQACGLRYVWRAANEGRVDTLLVEENYYQPARIRNKTLHLIADGARDGEGAPEDAVDETIAAVLNTSGRVVFFKPGELEECQRIAAILRY